MISLRAFHKTVAGLVALALPLLYGCSPDSQDAPVRVGLTSFPAYAYLNLAEEKGFLRETGFDFDIVDLSSLADVRTAFERGQVDVMTGTLMEQLVVLSRSKPEAQAFFVIDYSLGADQLLARDIYRSVADLKGKKIAFEPDSIDVAILHLALQSAGLTLDDIVPAPMSQLEIPEALRDGRIDAAEVYPPASVEILRAGGVVQLFDSSRIPYTVVDVLLADREFIESHKTELAALVGAFLRARQYASDHPEESERILARRIGIRPDEVRAAYDGIKFVEAGEQADLLKPGGTIEQKIRQIRDIFETYRADYQLPDRASTVTTIVVDGQ